MLAKLLKFSSFLTCMLCISFLSYSQKDTKPLTVKGELLDMSCYISGGASGEGHKACAAKCINNGSPMGLLTSDGKVYLLVENHKKAEAYASAKKFAGEQIEVSGESSDRGGIQGLVVNDVKEIKK